MYLQKHQLDQKMIWVITFVGLGIAVAALYSWTTSRRWPLKRPYPGAVVNLSRGSFDLLVNSVLNTLLTNESVITVPQPVDITSMLSFSEIEMLGLNSLQMASTTDLVAQMSNARIGQDPKPLRYDLSLCVKADDLNIKAMMTSYLPMYAKGPITIQILPIELAIKLSIFVDKDELYDFEGDINLKDEESKTSNNALFTMRITEMHFTKWSGLWISSGDENEDSSYSQKLLSWLTNCAAWITATAFMGTVESEITKIINYELVKVQISPLFTSGPHHKSSQNSSINRVDSSEQIANTTNNQASGLSSIITGPVFGLVNYAIQTAGLLFQSHSTSNSVRTNPIRLTRSNSMLSHLNSSENDQMNNTGKNSCQYDCVRRRKIRRTHSTEHILI